MKKLKMKEAVKTYCFKCGARPKELCVHVGKRGSIKLKGKEMKNFHLERHYTEKERLKRWFKKNGRILLNPTKVLRKYPSLRE